MDLRLFVRLFISINFLCLFSVCANAQSNNETAPTLLRVQIGGPYQLKDSYSILYDNPTQAAKLRDFQVIFYAPDGTVLQETEIETHPLAGNIETYALNGPVIGFSEIGLSVISLHSGNMDAFPIEVGNIVGMDRTEISIPADPPVEFSEQGNDSEVSTAEPPPLTPTLSDTEKARLTDTLSKSSRLLESLRIKSEDFARTKNIHAKDTQRLENLIQDTASLLKQTDSPALPDLEPQINALKANMITAQREAALSTTEITGQLTALSQLGTTVSGLEKQLGALKILSETKDADVTNVMTSLTEIEKQLDKLGGDISSLNPPNSETSSQIDAWDATYLDLKARIDMASTSVFNWPIVLGSILAGLIFLGLGAKILQSGKVKSRPSKIVLNQSGSMGVIFSASPMLTGNVAAPLAPTGQLAAAQLQMLSGPYAKLKDAYQATGRIGYAQQGVPTSEDYAFGTGFLISDRHIVTNRHVHGLYGHYLLDQSDPGGIEFIAEKGKDASDFVPFNGQAPRLLPALDIAIYTLARPVKNRLPIQLKSVETEDLLGRDIVVIGYPDTHKPKDSEVLAVVEPDPVFAVKRISQGRVFRHSTDTDTPLGVETPVTESKTSKFMMSAICHNASTMGGNSGSPLLDSKTGQLIGVHFAGFKVFNQEEAANLAMAIEQLTQNNDLNVISGVTPITDSDIKIS